MAEIGYVEVRYDIPIAVALMIAILLGILFWALRR